MSSPKITAMIPARMGSTRFKRKNLSLINNKPMIAYAIEASLQSKVFDRVVINSENIAFKEIADEYGVDFYLRPEALGSSVAKSDDVVYDFMKNNSGDITVWVNSIAPLQTGDEIKKVIGHFRENHLDSLITTYKEQVHCNFNGKPLNYSLDEIFAQTQDLIPVERFVYSIMMWKNATFMEKYEKLGHAIFCGQFGSCSVSRMASLLVKTEEDYHLIDSIVKSLEQKNQLEAKYREI